jgi:hypothetical protein
MHSFKSFTVQQINRMQGLDMPLWQSGYHDHALRAKEDLQAVVDYCLHNPVRADPVEDFHLYPLISLCGSGFQPRACGCLTFHVEQEQEQKLRLAAGSRSHEAAPRSRLFWEPVALRCD